MKRKLFALLLLCGMILSVQPVFAQYTGGNADGFASSRSDDILYDGTTPIITGAELPDIVNILTIDNPGGVTLTKNITVTRLLLIRTGTFNLNGFVVTFGANTALVEQSGSLVTGGGGRITATRTLNELQAGVNVAGLGLKLTSTTPLGETQVARGHESQALTLAMTSANRFYDVAPENNQNLDVTVDFSYDESELSGIPEADLALFKSKDAMLSNNSSLARTPASLAQDEPTWEFVGGNVNTEANTISKGGISDFSRLAVGRAFVFLAEQSVKIDENVISEGDIHSNGKITFEKGDPGTHTGNLTAVGDVTIEKNNTITGNVFAGDDLHLSGNATITGTAEEQAAVSAIVFPIPDFIAGGADIEVPKRGTFHLEPGSYDDVKVEKQGTLFLKAGDYFLNELDLEPGAILSADVSLGPVNINVVKKLDFDDRVEVAVTPSGQAGSNQVTFTTLQRNKVDIGEDALILGWMIAPHAEVHFDDDSRFKGAVVAQAIRVDEKVTFVPHSSRIVLRKPAPLLEDEVAEDEISLAPTSYELAQNYPNPFNPSTTIAFSLKEAGFVQLKIYNIRGQEVRALVAASMSPGRHAVNWDGKDDHGQTVPSGVYLYKLSANGFEMTKKMALMK